MAAGPSLSVVRRADAVAGDAAPSETVGFGPLTGLAGFMLRLTQVQLYEAYFAEFEAGGIKPGGIGILTAIAENPGVRQGVLADALRIKWSNMAKIMRSLSERGLIERRVPDEDRRAFELHLTAEGEALVARMLPAIKRNDRAATAMLSDDERRTLLALLAKVAAGRGEGAS